MDSEGQLKVLENIKNYKTSIDALYKKININEYRTILSKSQEILATLE